MNVKIKETGKLETLIAIDRKSGVNWVSDLIGNAGAMNDGQFTWSEDDDTYLVSQADYDWWTQYIADTEATEAEAEKLANELGLDVEDVRSRIEENTGADYGDHRSQAIMAMDDIREEHA